MQVSQRGIVTVIAPEGFLTGGEEIEALEQAINHCLYEGKKYLVVDCTGIKHVNSVGLGALLVGRSRAVRSGGRFVLARIDAHLKNILLITKFSLIFDVHPTVELAIVAIAVQPEAQGT